MHKKITLLDILNGQPFDAKFLDADFEKNMYVWNIFCYLSNNKLGMALFNCSSPAFI
jgi:hypothetical protein